MGLFSGKAGHFVRSGSGQFAGCALLWLASGCSGHAGTMFEPVRAPTERFHVESTHAVIVDERPDAEQRQSFDTPTFSTPGQSASRALVLRPELQAQLQSDLNRWVASMPGTRLLFEIRVERADAGWRASWTRETAFTTVRLDVCVFDAADRVVVGAASAAAAGESWGLDVADDESGKLMNSAVRQAWSRFLSDGNIRAINEALRAKQQHAARTSIPASRCGPWAVENRR